MPMIIPADAKQTLQRLTNSLSADRNTYESTWQEIRDYVLPYHGRGLLQNNSAELPDGRLRTHKILDNTAFRALEISTAGMQAGVNSPARPWFDLGTDDEELNKYKPVQIWMHSAKEVIRGLYAASGMYDMFHSIYYELFGFGTGVGTLQHSITKTITPTPLTVGEYWLGKSTYTDVDIMLRKYNLNALQIVDKFGLGRVSNNVKRSYEKADMNTRFLVCQLIAPNTCRVPSALGEVKPFITHYWEDGFPEERILGVSGYRSKPFFAVRWRTVAGDTYGVSPTQTTLPDIKALQNERRDVLKASAKVVNPPVIAPSSMTRHKIRAMAGGVTHDDSLMKAEGLRPLYQIQPDINAMIAEVNDTRQAIRSGLYTDLFTLIANTVDQRKTATEVIALKEEKMMVLGTVLDHVHTEMHTPCIQASLDYAARNGLLPEPPKELLGKPLKIEYTSVLAQAQKMAGVAPIEQIAGFVGNLAGADPRVLDKIDMSKAVDEYAGAIGVVPEIVRSDDEYNAIQQQKAEAAAQQQQLEAAQQGAETAKVLADTDMGNDNSALQMLAGGLT